MVRARRQRGRPPGSQARRARQTGARPTRLGGRHGQETTQDPRGLRRLPRRHPRHPRPQHGIVAGEPRALKDASVVRRRAGRKRPELDEFGTSPSSLSCWIRFSAAGAHLAWRIKNGAKSVPLKTARTLPDGSELVMLHESDGMRARRRHEADDPAAPRLPDTMARLVSFTITARTRSRMGKTTLLRGLTTRLAPQAYPAPQRA